MRPKRRLAAVALLGASLGLAGCFNFEVTKEVTGGTSQGPFEVEISCPEAGGTETLTFDGPGTETSMDFQFPPNTMSTSCTVTETETAGAAAVSLTCNAPIPPGVVCNSVPNGVVVSVPGPDFVGQTLGITVVNDFTPPPTPPPGVPPADPGTPAAPVVGAPRFTG